MVAALCFAEQVVATEAGSPRRTRQVAAVMHSRVLDALASGEVRPAEEGFLRKAAEIARLQLSIAEIGAIQAQRTEVRSHAEQLKSDNRQLIDALNALMERKSVGDPSPTPTGRAYGGLAEKSGADFDREFVRIMAEVHEQTIALFEQARSEAKDPDVRELAGSQLPMLRAHRNRIIELRKSFE